MSTRPIKVNFIVNLLSPMTRIVVALVTVPLYLHHIGDARYGVMSIVWVLLGLFGFLDLGLSRAVTNALAKLRDAPQAHRARVLLTTFGLNLGIGVLGGVVLYVFGGLMLKHFVSMPNEISAEVSWSLPWIACLLPLTLISAAGAGALESRELFLTREFDPDFRDDSGSGCASRRGYFRQSLAHGRYPHGCSIAGIGRDTRSRCRLSFGRAVLTSRDRLGRSAQVAGLWRLDVRHEGDLSRPRLRRSICHWVGDGRRGGRSLRGADEPCPKKRRHPGGVRAHALSPHVQPVRRGSSRAGKARALNDGLWLRHHLRSGDDPFSDLLSILDQR